MDAAQKVVSLVVGVSLAALMGACGGGHSTHDAGAGGRTINIDMRDHDFSVASIDVRVGEPVQLVFHNRGAVTHDAYIGDDAAQIAHEQEMRASIDPGHGHPDGVTVAAGETGTLSHTFDNPGPTIIGCHEAGHYALGMRIKVNVT